MRCVVALLHGASVLRTEKSEVGSRKSEGSNTRSAARRVALHATESRNQKSKKQESRPSSTRNANAAGCLSCCSYLIWRVVVVVVVCCCLRLYFVCMWHVGRTTVNYHYYIKFVLGFQIVEVRSCWIGLSWPSPF